ncbi:hypothetical protein FKX85_16000 [Echinicola soli]|uniref:Fibrobacter succinogenes major paralogous domain-containing protein n=1 Tax=Echinicola soli TaxID=2591634 RepID=A0A514CKV3_9BACT|nr:fibrobacter succinogenes major paralogous domain-containing protein [Echinicola soli]QDH80461.1 hypothetical protein FKX85_16000 [Echinicola soli]
MKNNFIIIAIITLLWGSCTHERDQHSPVGKVQLTTLSLESFGVINPNARTTENSSWKHILPEEATLVFTNKSTGQGTTLFVDPRQFGKDLYVQLPFGDYNYRMEIEGDIFEDYLPIEVSGDFTLDQHVLSLSLVAQTSYGLVTVEAAHIERALLNETYEMPLTTDGKNYYTYVKEGIHPTLTVYEYFNGQAISLETQIPSQHHEHFYLKITEDQGEVNFVSLAIGMFTYHEESIDIIAGDGWVKDADGNIYKTVKIGNQYWMAENLRATTYCNGDPLEVIRPEYNYFLQGANLYPDFVVEEESDYSDQPIYFYNPKAALSDKNICPCDWHVSTDQDWMELEQVLGIPENELTNRVRGEAQMAADQLMALDWEEIHGYLPSDVTITDPFGFSAYPYGFYLDDWVGTNQYEGYAWYNQNYDLAWWSVIENDVLSREIRTVNDLFDSSPIYRDDNPSKDMLTIRCVKDN